MLPSSKSARPPPPPPTPGYTARGKAVANGERSGQVLCPYQCQAGEAGPPRCRPQQLCKPLPQDTQQGQHPVRNRSSKRPILGAHRPAGRPHTEQAAKRKAEPTHQRNTHAAAVRSPQHTEHRPHTHTTPGNHALNGRHGDGPQRCHAPRLGAQGVQCGLHDEHRRAVQRLHLVQARQRKPVWGWGGGGVAPGTVMRFTAHALQAIGHTQRDATAHTTSAARRTHAAFRGEGDNQGGKGWGS
jgi:hypothetical protein